MGKDSGRLIIITATKFAATSNWGCSVYTIAIFV